VLAGEVAAADGGVEMKNFTRLGPILALLASTAVAWSDPARFDTPDAAVSAVVAALEQGNRVAVLEIFGPENEDLLSSDNPGQDKEDWGKFLGDVKSFSRIDVVDDRATLYVGRERWPFPVPLVHKDGAWSFDPEDAREEILMRRIGLNELAVIDIMRRFGDVQDDFRRKDHDNDGVREFAASILSSPGKRDGLYWPDTPGTERSPLGDFIARANDSGYNFDGADRDPEPYVGYYFRILQGQGPAAPGGAYSYMIAGNMLGGYALLAYPAVYDDTGIMSFMVGESGIVYEADLGEDTLAKAGAITRFDPGEGWAPIE
jgi:hypothetical protein